MDVLTAAATLLLCAPPAPSAPSAVAQWEPIIEKAAARFALPAAWIARVMAAESRGHTTLSGRPITSPVGAMGLMQIMPDTWNYLRGRYGLAPDPFDAHDNIFAGAAYLRELYDRYGYPNLFAAYNAGPGRVNAYLAHDRALPAETRTYVQQIAGTAAVEREVSNSPAVLASANPLFFVNHATTVNKSTPSSGASLFVALSSAAP